MRVLTISIIIISLWLTGCTSTDIKPIKQVLVNEQKVQVRLASSQSELAKGLSGVSELADNQGMLFIFPTKDYYRFWMKDMLIPLDIIWLDNNTIVDLSDNVPPPANLAEQEDLPKYSTAEKADYVLEVNADFIENNQVMVGDTVEYIR